MSETQEMNSFSNYKKKESGQPKQSVRSSRKANATGKDITKQMANYMLKSVMLQSIGRMGLFVLHFLEWKIKPV